MRAAKVEGWGSDPGMWSKSDRFTCGATSNSSRFPYNLKTNVRLRLCCNTAVDLTCADHEVPLGEDQGVVHTPHDPPGLVFFREGAQQVRHSAALFCCSRHLRQGGQQKSCCLEPERRLHSLRPQRECLLCLPVLRLLLLLRFLSGRRCIVLGEKAHAAATPLLFYCVQPLYSTTAVPYVLLLFLFVYPPATCTAWERGWHGLLQFDGGAIWHTTNVPKLPSLAHILAVVSEKRSVIPPHCPVAGYIQQYSSLSTATAAASYSFLRGESCFLLSGGLGLSGVL